MAKVEAQYTSSPNASFVQMIANDLTIRLKVNRLYYLCRRDRSLDSFSRMIIVFPNHSWRTGWKWYRVVLGYLPTGDRGFECFERGECASRCPQLTQYSLSVSLSCMLQMLNQLSRIGERMLL